MFIMIDGIDGSGKSTVIQAWKEYLASQDNAIFDLKKYWEKQGRYPTLSELKSYDFIFSCEPTRVGIGQVIREELIKQGSNYSASVVAEACSLDRLILYTKVIIPLLKSGKCVIQDRGISSSLIYQPLQDKKLDFKTISSLIGNKLTLKYRPDYLVLLDVKPEIALRRLSTRSDKQDNAIFERLNFQKKIAKKFKDKNFQNIFLKRKTKIHYLPANEDIGIMRKKAIELLRKLISHP